MQVVLRHVGAGQGQQQHQGHVGRYLAHALQEGDLLVVADQGEAHGDEDRREDVGKEGAGGHLLQVAAQLLCHHGSCRGHGADGAGQQALHQQPRIAGQLQEIGERHDGAHYQELRQQHEEVPPGGAHLVEVHLAERDVEHPEGAKRQAHLPEWLQPRGEPVQRADVGEHQVDGRPQADGDGERPVLDKSDYP